jgi:hypothetical protein
VYAASLDHAEWRYWRDAPAPDFSQRFTGTFSDDGNTITRRRDIRRCVRPLARAGMLIDPRPASVPE